MSLSEILTKCRSTIDTVRNQAESELDTLATQDLGSLLLACAQEMSQETTQKENRLLCGTVIKNMICFNTNQQGKWEQLAYKLKLEIKNLVMSCLGSDIKEVRKAAAITVAGKYNLFIIRNLPR